MYKVQKFGETLSSHHSQTGGVILEQCTPIFIVPSFSLNLFMNSKEDPFDGFCSSPQTLLPHTKVVLPFFWPYEPGVQGVTRLCDP